MVLQNANVAKDENAPPTTPSRPKGLVSRIYEEASSRGRTRSSGTSHGAKYRVEAAKRRKAKAKAKGSLRINVPRPPTAADVEMSNASSSSSSSSYPINLSSELSRPHYREIPRELYLEIQPELADLDLDTLHHALRSSSQYLLRALHNIRVEPIKDKLPDVITVHSQEMSDCLPSHMLAVFNAPPMNAGTSTAPRKVNVTLFPTHSLILLTHCTNIGKPPATIPPPTVGEVGDTEVMLPVWRICLPFPSVFPQLSTYLYNKQLGPILRYFMPGPPPADLMTNPVRRQGFALHISQTFTSFSILKCIFSVQGLWQNMCALGVFDDELWAAVDVMWETLLMAITIATGNPSLMLPRPRNPSTSQPTASQFTASPSTASPMNESS